MPNLITAYEVVKYSLAGNDYPTAHICELIPQVEQEFARQCLGEDLYEYLQGVLTPYPASTSEWDVTETYDEDDIVVRNGCLFISLINSNATDPLSETGDWEAFEKFTAAGANLLWTGYLRRLLALKIYAASLVPTTWRSGAGGVVVNMGDQSGFRSATKSELSDIKTNALAEVERVTANMLHWLKENATANDLVYSDVCATMCATPGTRQRRWAFRY